MRDWCTVTSTVPKAVRRIACSTSSSCSRGWKLTPGVVSAAVACEMDRAMAMLAERMKQPLPWEEAWRLIRDVP